MRHFHATVMCRHAARRHTCASLRKMMLHDMPPARPRFPLELKRFSPISAAVDELSSTPSKSPAYMDFDGTSHDLIKTGKMIRLGQRLSRCHATLAQATTRDRQESRREARCPPSPLRFQADVTAHGQHESASAGRGVTPLPLRAPTPASFFDQQSFQATILMMATA